MSTEPAACAGEVAVMVVAFTTVKAVALVPPKLTAVAPVKLVPVMVTAVPPASSPLFGATAVTVGTGAAARAGTMTGPKAYGEVATGTVFVTVLLAVAITETLSLRVFAT